MKQMADAVYEKVTTERKLKEMTERVAALAGSNIANQSDAVVARLTRLEQAMQSELAEVRACLKALENAFTRNVVAPSSIGSSVRTARRKARAKP